MVGVYRDRDASIVGKLMAEELGRYAMPYLQQCKTIAGLNRLVNHESPHSGQVIDSPFVLPYWHDNNLLLAHLVDDPNFEQIRNQIEQYYAPKWLELPEQYSVRRSVYDMVLQARRAGPQDGCHARSWVS